MLRSYLNIWKWEWIFGRSVKAISSPGIRSPCSWPKDEQNCFLQKFPLDLYKRNLEIDIAFILIFGSCFILREIVPKLSAIKHKTLNKEQTTKKFQICFPFSIRVEVDVNNRKTLVGQQHNFIHFQPNFDFLADSMKCQTESRPLLCKNTNF